MELKPCPFCGVTAHLRLLQTYTTPLLYEDDESVVVVRCDNCEAKGPSAIDEEEATELWNQRNSN